MTEKNRVLKNFLSMTSANIFTQIISFALMIYIAREFGPGDFGKIGFVTAFVSYFLTISVFGLKSVGLINIAEDKNDIEKIVNRIVSLRLFIAIITYAILLVILFVIDRDFNIKVMILMQGTIMFASAISLDWVFNATQEMKITAKATVIERVIYAILIVGILFILGYKNIVFVSICLAIAHFISSFYTVLKYKKYYHKRIKIIFEKSNFMHLIKDAYPFLFSGFLARININIDMVILGFICVESEVGMYNAAYKIVNILLVFITLIFVPIQPLLIEYHRKNEKKFLENLTNNLRKIVYLVAFPLCIGSFVLKDEIIIGLFGESYSKANNVFAILMFYVAILYIREIYGYQLTAWKLQNKYMKIVALSAGYNLIFNLLLIPKYGIEAAAINTLISEIINYLLMRRVSKKEIIIPNNIKMIIKISGASLMMGAIAYLLKNTINSFIILIIMSMSAYLILILIFKVYSIQEIRKLIKGE